MHRRQNRLPSRALRRGVVALLWLALLGRGVGDDFVDAQKLYLTGQYGDCLEACLKAVAEGRRDDDWEVLRAQTLLTLGRYPQAEEAVGSALLRSASSIRLRLTGYETARAAGQPALARTRLQEINELVGSRSWAYRNPPDMVALGRAALLLGADPRTVLERIFDPVQKADPQLREVYLARGQLALDKHDYALAARAFDEALKKFPDDPDLLCGLARAYEPSRRGQMLTLLERALERNERHVPALLLLADHLLDAEEYTEAEQVLARVLKVNPWHPEAWAYRAVLAHLRNDPAGQTDARAAALQYWKTNPSVDHLMGLKLSQNYRFAEGAARQRLALALDEDFLPARIQLAQDLLRLGEVTEGWELAEQVNRRDGYDVTAHNLVTLRDTMRTFSTLTNDHFILRMSAREASLYGDRALALLERARARLTEKYGLKLESPTVVEIFPEQKDFAVRTFGMPHNPGFLGVCFGRVITANSPASQGGDPANWEAVLWHEFAHVVTLQLTRNRMPRWLSEGISVYEELQANPAWGQRMNPRYREMVLGGDLTPVSELSAAFLAPKSELHLQFAYYQSSLVVEFLIERFGFDPLQGILRDLGNGMNINDAIPKHTAPLKQIEKDFAAFARARAEALAPGLDWRKPERGRISLSRLAADSGDAADDARRSGGDSGSSNDLRRVLWRALAPVLTNLVERPSRETNAPTVTVTESEEKPSSKPNYWSLIEQARKLVAEEQWGAARAPLRTLIELYPDQSGPDNAYALLASAHRALGETVPEREALERWAAGDASALDAYLRLMQIAEREGDWKTVSENAGRYLAVNPLVPQPWRHLARASEAEGETVPAVSAYRKLLLLDPADPAEIHFRLAQLLLQSNDPAARRHVLQALEEAPRFRDAHRLLLRLAQVQEEETHSGATGVSSEARPGSKK